jgi:hydroxymethylpyrimidine pyrophosphatase-like HAD family hydrolase
MFPLPVCGMHRHLMDQMKGIRLIVLDIDGVLTGGETLALDLSLLQSLAELNRNARADNKLPAVTLCSGRPAPYVEAFLQGMDGHIPAVFENGAGLYIPDGYQFLPHPDLRENGAIMAVKKQLEETMVRESLAYFQPGKNYSLSLFAYHPADTHKLLGWVETALGPLVKTVDLVFSVSCLNILPKGSNKAKGLEFLAVLTGVQLDEMLGVGDSEVDLEFLNGVGYSAAPANAVQAVKDIVDYVSPFQTGEGVRDILRHFAIV